jgi:hypothetical protein
VREADLVDSLNVIYKKLNQGRHSDKRPEIGRVLDAAESRLEKIDYQEVQQTIAYGECLVGGSSKDVCLAKATASTPTTPILNLPSGAIPWKKYPITDPLLRSGCDEVATEIQRQIGGEIFEITPGGSKARYLGRVDGELPGKENVSWANHFVVVKDQLVFDLLTGPSGQAPDAYKQRWEYADGINFGF